MKGNCTIVNNTSAVLNILIYIKNARSGTYNYSIFLLPDDTVRFHTGKKLQKLLYSVSCIYRSLSSRKSSRR